MACAHNDQNHQTGITRVQHIQHANKYHMTHCSEAGIRYRGCVVHTFKVGKIRYV